MVSKSELHYYQSHDISSIDTSFEALFPGISKALRKVPRHHKTMKKKLRNNEAQNMPPARATSLPHARTLSPTVNPVEFDLEYDYNDSPSISNAIPFAAAMELPVTVVPFDGYHSAEEEEEINEETSNQEKEDDQVVIDWNPADEEEEHEREEAMRDEAMNEAEEELEREIEMLFSDGESNQPVLLQSYHLLIGKQLRCQQNIVIPSGHLPITSSMAIRRILGGIISIYTLITSSYHLTTLLLNCSHAYRVWRRYHMTAASTPAVALLHSLRKMTVVRTATNLGVTLEESPAMSSTIFHSSHD
jgi:hypothetical protein